MLAIVLVSLLSLLPTASSFSDILTNLVVSAPAVPTARSPCPSSQLLRYIVHANGNGDAEAAVLARISSSTEEDKSWHEVGRVTACTDDHDDNDDDNNNNNNNDDPLAFSLDSAVARAGVAAHSLAKATMLQGRLISEHAYRLYPHLREAKRGGESRLEFGLEMMPDKVAPVPQSAAEDGDVKNLLDMMKGVGFVGHGRSIVQSSTDKEEKRSSRGLYEEFWSNEDAQEYDGDSMRIDINNLLASDNDEAESAPAILVCSRPNCNAAATVRTALEERRILYTDFAVEKLSPMHAELAFLTGKASMPYVFVNGKIVHGDNNENSSDSSVDAVTMRVLELTETAK
mmetsp:Transcript_11440/g.16777  ORF Transcript_11440/g.16777 Transcript_11440/m.16777 type:complete len:343 (-) Transcript_11440:75-1103(-)